jgi:glutathione synthase/RimK-type ligase-like ATP-grasp enzyme
MFFSFVKLQSQTFTYDMSRKGRDKKHLTPLLEEIRSRVERFLIVLLIVRNYLFEVIRILKNRRNDAKKYNLSSFSILYNTLIKYPLLGFQPSAFFMYRLYENSFTEYLTLFEETNCIAKINKHEPYLLDNKLEFSRTLHNGIRTPKLLAFSDASTKKINYVFEPHTKKVVIKPIAGRGGIGVRIVPSENLKETVQKYHKKCIVEECIEQHTLLNDIFNGSVNTLRVLTYKKNEEITIPSVILRVGRIPTQHVDNIAKGGICIDIDNDTGMLGKGYTFYDYGHHEYTSHPDTNHEFFGEKIPFFQEAKDLAVAAHRCFPGFVIVGWDIALTETGPVLIEGNRIPDLSLHQIFSPLREKLRRIYQ